MKIMKKTIRIIAVAMVAVMLCLCLASCGKTLSGLYKSPEVLGTYTTYKFSGSKVTAEAYVAGVKVTDGSFEGKYAIKDGEITFTYEINGEEKSLTQSFEELDDGSIKIGIVTYKKG